MKHGNRCIEVHLGGGVCHHTTPLTRDDDGALRAKLDVSAHMDVPVTFCVELILLGGDPMEHWSVTVEDDGDRDEVQEVPGNLGAAKSHAGTMLANAIEHYLDHAIEHDLTFVHTPPRDELAEVGELDKYPEDDKGAA